MDPQEGKPIDAINDADILEASMFPPEHKRLLLKHLKRLRVLALDQDAAVHALNHEQRKARWQLAHFTELFRKYQARQDKDDFGGEEKEYIAIDIIDRCILASMTHSQWGALGNEVQSSFATQEEVVYAREAAEDAGVETREVEHAMWNGKEGAGSLVPDHSKVVDIGESIDWDEHALKKRSQSWDNLVDAPCRKDAESCQKPEERQSMFDRGLDHAAR